MPAHQAFGEIGKKADCAIRTHWISVVVIIEGKALLPSIAAALTGQVKFAFVFTSM